MIISLPWWCIYAPPVRKNHPSHSALGRHTIHLTSASKEKLEMTHQLAARQHQLVATITINDTTENVWSVLKDFDHVYTWAPSVEASYGLNEQQHEVGAGRYCKLKGFGEIKEYILAWDEGRGFVYDVTPLGPLHNAISRWKIIPVNERLCQLEVSFKYDIRFGLLGRLMHALVMRKKLETSLPDTLSALKLRVETGKLCRPLLPAVAKSFA